MPRNASLYCQDLNFKKCTSKTKLISNPIKEITSDTSVENDKKLDELLPDKDKLFIVVYLEKNKFF